MNAATKLALAFLTLAVIGAVLIVAGLAPHYRAAGVVIGIIVMFTAPWMFAAIWRSR